MNPVGGFLLFALFIAVAVAILSGIQWVLRQGVNAVSRPINQHLVQPGRHAEGKRLVNQELHATSSLAPAPFVAALSAQLGYRAPSAVRGQLFIAEASDQGIHFRCGSQLAIAFDAYLDVLPIDKGSALELSILEWKTQDGVVTGVEAMQKLFRDVEAGIKAIDASAQTNYLQANR